MPVIFEDGSCANPVFVFKGKRLLYRVVDQGGVQVTETISECLPRFSHVFMRDEGGGMDKHIFVKWASVFVKEISDLTSHG